MLMPWRKLQARPMIRLRLAMLQERVMLIVKQQLRRRWSMLQRLRLRPHQSRSQSQSQNLD